MSVLLHQLSMAFSFTGYRYTSLQPDMNEYLRPWKLLTLAFGIALLIVGSFYYQAPDWDIPISFIMAFFTYITAPWTLRVIIKLQWKKIPMALFFAWFTVDGCYWLYWRFRNPVALELMREANFLASLCLYTMCGLVWYYRGTLKEFFQALRTFRITRDTQ